MNVSETSPRPAATTMLLRDGTQGLEVFMVVRHHQIDFASGALVFPGGSLDAGDHAVALNEGLCTKAEDYDAVELGFRVAAIRETFEETGILLARLRESEAVIPAGRLKQVAAAHRAALCEGKASLAEMLVHEGLVLAVDLLSPFAHWITPPSLPKRFDTHFFLAHAPEDHVGMHDGSESVESIWISPQRAIEESETGRYTLVFATRMNLLKLARSGSVAAAFETARRNRIVTVMPEVRKTADGVRLRIPAEADYGGEEFAIRAPA